MPVKIMNEVEFNDPNNHNNKKGYDGEKKIIDIIKKNLDNRPEDILVFHNVILPDEHETQMDIVVVTNKFALIIESKNASKIKFFNNNVQVYQNGNYSSTYDPIYQNKYHKINMVEYIKNSFAFGDTEKDRLENNLKLFFDDKVLFGKHTTIEFDEDITRDRKNKIENNSMNLFCIVSYINRLLDKESYIYDDQFVNDIVLILSNNCSDKYVKEQYVRSNDSFVKQVALNYLEETVRKDKYELKNKNKEGKNKKNYDYYKCYSKENLEKILEAQPKTKSDIKSITNHPNTTPCDILDRKILDCLYGTIYSKSEK